MEQLIDDARSLLVIEKENEMAQTTEGMVSEQIDALRKEISSLSSRLSDHLGIYPAQPTTPSRPRRTR